MSPRSLLFSSDQETSRQLGQALHELEFHVEHCPEIFMAVEKLTSHSFEVIAADWDDGVEASFLLNTARDLKSNCTAFTVALARPEMAHAAREGGANLVVSKPVLPGQVRYALLTSQDFVARMQKWQPGFEVAHAMPTPKLETPQAPAAETQPSSPLRAWIQPSPLVEKRVAPVGAPVVPRIAPPSGHRNDAGIQTLFTSAYAEPLAASKPKHRLRNLLRGGAFGLALIVAGTMIYVTLLKSGVDASSSKVEPPAADAATVWHRPSLLRRGYKGGTRSFATPLAASGVAGSSSIRIEPMVYYDPLAPHEVAMAADQPAPMQNLAQIDPEPTSEQAEFESALPLRDLNGVPQSLKNSVPAVSVRESAPRPSISLLAALEPVSLSEDDSQKLVTQKIQPSYPEQAVRTGLQGTVVLQALVGKDGAIQDLKLIHGSFLLGEAAFQAVKQWRYKPYFLNGRAVATQTFVTVDFKLPSVARIAEPQR